MVRSIILVAVIHASALVGAASADGLIFQLPADGTTAEFSGTVEGDAKRVAKKRDDVTLSKLEHEELVTIKSVGAVERAEQRCRWIELQRQTKRAGESRQTEHILKLLIPEQFLVRGEDPLDHVILTFFNPQPVERKRARVQEGFSRIQYEIDRFRPVFPARLEKVVTLPARTIKTPVGTFTDCEVLSGSTTFDRPLLGNGRWEFKNEWEIAIHKDAPFGVVELRCRSEGREINDMVTSHLATKWTLTLSRVATDAKSDLPVNLESTRSDEAER